MLGMCESTLISRLIQIRKMKRYDKGVFERINILFSNSVSIVYYIIIINFNDFAMSIFC